MKYKVGDKVKIKSLEWYNLNKNRYDYIQLLKYQFNYYMTKYCGLTATIKQVNPDEHNYFIDIDSDFCWTDEMFEDETMEEYTELINIANNYKNNVCTTIDWEHRRYEIAKAILTGYSSGEGFYSGIDRTKEHCERAIMYADELIRQLKQ